jgi:hypothetical protein
MGIFKQIANPEENTTTGGIFKQIAAKQKKPKESYSAGVMSRLNKNAQNVGEGFLKAGQNIISDYNKLKQDIASKPDAGLLEKGAETGQFAGQVGGNVVRATGSIIGGVAGFFGSLIPQSLRDNLSERAKKALDKSTIPPEEVAKRNAEANQDPDIIKTRERIQNLVSIADENPDTKQAVVNLLETVLLKAGDVKVPKLSPVLSTIKQDLKNVVSATLDTTKSTINKGSSLFDAMKASREAKALEASSAKVTEMISPKATLKEARLAQTQGRLIEGKKPTLFRSGTADVILPAEKTKAATKTIIQEIPNAQKMTPGELYKAVDTKITETATNLRPKMQATKIKPKTIEKLNTDWEALKKQQMLDAPATEEANVLKRQSKFESFLQKSKSDNHADLWDTRIAYDDSIPANVKKANSLSSESLQLQREEWLQNRQILNDAFESATQPEFRTMSSLYEAKNGLLSQTKVEGVLPSKLVQWTKDNPKKWAAVKLYLGYEAVKRMGLDFLP